MRQPRLKGLAELPILRELRWKRRRIRHIAEPGNPPQKIGSALERDVVILVFRDIERRVLGTSHRMDHRKANRYPIDGMGLEDSAAPYGLIAIARG
jgi:hypothetical protein